MPDIGKRDETRRKTGRHVEPQGLYIGHEEGMASGERRQDLRRIPGARDEEGGGNSIRFRSGRTDYGNTCHPADG